MLAGSYKYFYETTVKPPVSCNSRFTYNHWSVRTCSERVVHYFRCETNGIVVLH